MTLFRALLGSLVLFVNISSCQTEKKKNSTVAQPTDADADEDVNSEDAIKNSIWTDSSTNLELKKWQEGEVVESYRFNSKIALLRLNTPPRGEAARSCRTIDENQGLAIIKKFKQLKARDTKADDCDTSNPDLTIDVSENKSPPRSYSTSQCLATAGDKQSREYVDAAELSEIY